MKLEAMVQINERFANILCWINLSFMTKRKYFTVIRFTTCRKLNRGIFTIFNKEFKFRYKTKSFLTRRQVKKALKDMEKDL